MSQTADRDKYARLGILSSNLSGILVFLGGSAALHWETRSWPWWIALPAFLAVLAAMMLLPLMLLDVNGSVKSRVLCVLLIVSLTVVEVAIVGYSLHGLPVLSWAPAWPTWVGIVLLVLSGFGIWMAIGLLIYDLEVSRAQEKARREGAS